MTKTEVKYEECEVGTRSYMPEVSGIYMVVVQTIKTTIIKTYIDEIPGMYLETIITEEI